MPYQRDSHKACNFTKFVNTRSMHEHAMKCVNVLYQMFEQRCRDTHVCVRIMLNSKSVML